MKKGKKNTAFTIIVMLMVTAALLFGYYYYSNKEKTKENSEKQNTQVEKIVQKNLKKDYPATPREVVKLYSRIITCYYNFELTEEETDQLIDQNRKLFDEELNKQNPKKTYAKNLKQEIQEYRKDGKMISQYKIEQGSSVKYYEKKNIKYANVLVEYLIKSKEGTTKSNEQFVLRQAKDGNWKILGWKLVGDIDFDNH